MATVHYTTQVQENGLLSIPKDKYEALGIKPGASLQVILSTEATETPELPPIAAGESLADFLGDFIGCVEGSGTNNSENTGEKFTEYLVKKHESGHLSKREKFSL